MDFAYWMRYHVISRTPAKLDILRRFICRHRPTADPVAALLSSTQYKNIDIRAQTVETFTVIGEKLLHAIYNTP
jgi:hypothetical protein